MQDRKTVSICSLKQFPPPAGEDYVTIYEKGGSLFHEPLAEAINYGKSLRFPQVNISQELSRPSMSRESAKSAFLDCGGKPSLTQIWQEDGLHGIISSVLEDHPENSKLKSYIKKSIECLLSYISNSPIANDRLLSKISTNNNWKSGSVRCLDWHTFADKLAICFKDDTIKIYSCQTKVISVTPLLKHNKQVNVCKIAWRPYIASVLAVGCENGILIWKIDPTSLASRPTNMELLEGHKPICDIVWHPYGNLLASASPIDNSVMVWDVELGRREPLKRFGGGVSLLRWSDDGSRLLSSYTSSLFRVWDTQTWQYEKWSLSGRGSMTAACWNKNRLIFANDSQPYLHCIVFHNAENCTSEIGSMQCIDVTTCTTNTMSGEEVRVGGIVRDIKWTSERLAVLFRETSFVALFSTSTRPSFSVLPIGFVRGPNNSIPMLIDLKSNSGKGIILTMIWSEDTLTYIPLCTSTEENTIYESFTEFEPSAIYSTVM
ncbi:DgyrCDS13281 [Dimorphilus gyrociliatus]|uniref:DgyrCDS13281 n=1 Tax=Dimorphilus gyrociliatus TaxID=2664684 RepID=A0A7I8WA76_9ANNE|nr:DgyrCDS13281 [Dimorphilus gyrociliatus]